MSYQQIYERRLSQAMQRKASAKSRATTALAREFFSSDNTANTLDRYNDDQNCDWISLIRRLVKLSDYLQERSSGGNNVTDESFPLIVSNKIGESRLSHWGPQCSTRPHLRS
eukprot:scaffold20425_cov156-Skeletonema_menzelii.AAC.5